MEARGQTKKENILWLASFKDIPTIDALLVNYSVWKMAIKNVCQKQNSSENIEHETAQNNKVESNNCKIANILITRMFYDNMKLYALKERACGFFR